VRLTTTEHTAGIQYTLVVTNVKDTQLNAIGATNNSGSYTAIGRPAQVIGATATDSRHVSVVFDETVDATTANTATNYAISPSLAVSAAVLQGDGKTVLLTSAAQAKGTPYTVTATGVKDMQKSPASRRTTPPPSPACPPPTT